METPAENGFNLSSIDQPMPEKSTLPEYGNQLLSNAILLN